MTKNQNRVTDRLRTGSIVPAGSRFSAAGRDPSYRGGGGGSFDYSLPRGYYEKYPRQANYSIDGINPFEDFESISGWTLSNSTIEIDDTHAMYGHAIKFTNTGNVASMAKSITPVVTPSGLFRIHMYIEDVSKITTGQSFYCYIDSTTNQTKYAEFKVTGTKLVNGWQWVDMPISAFTLGGGEVWTNNRIKLTLIFAFVSGQTTNIWIDRMQYVFSARKKIVLTFDDGLKNLLNYAIPSMDRFGLRSTFYVPPTSVGSSGSYMSLSDLRSLSDRGYSVCGHSYDHTNLTTLADAAAVQSNIEQQIDWFTAAGLIYADQHLHMAYPFGAYDPKVVQGALAAGVKTARATFAGYQVPFFDPIQSSLVAKKAFTIPCAYVLDSSATLSGAISAIESATSEGPVVVLLGHDIVTTTPTGGQFAASEFDSLCEYIYSKRADFDVETIPSLYNGFSSF